MIYWLYFCFVVHQKIKKMSDETKKEKKTPKTT